MTKKILSVALAGMIGFSAFAQEEAKKPEGFVFTPVVENPITKVQNQNHSGTCWSFSSLGFFEAELLRMGKGDVNLSEMFLVHKTMEDRAEAAVRLHGDISFSPGGSFYDAVYCLKHYGMVPEEVMPGIMYDDTLHNHDELGRVAEGYVNAIAKSNSRKLTNVWKKGLCAIYDTYLGECPETFTYNGKEYTPMSYVAELGLDMNDYVSLTSFTHHPFYEPFIIEVQDNWRWGASYNLPLDEFMEVCDYAVKHGYSFAWGSDVSEAGFTRDGVCVVPDVDAPAPVGSDMARWTGLSVGEKRREMLSKPSKEMEITQEMRQVAYDNWETTDDHGMMIYGIAKDQNGKEYFMVKNSWGDAGKYHGHWYASKAFVAYKTMNILVHKDGIPKALRKKMGIK